MAEPLTCPHCEKLLTDDQVIELLSTDSTKVVATAQDWLDQHPPTV